MSQPSRQEIRKSLAKALRGTLDAYANDLRQLRERELRKDDGMGGQADAGSFSMSEMCKGGDMCKGEHKECSACGKSIVSLAHNSSGKCGSCVRKPPVKKAMKKAETVGTTATGKDSRAAGSVLPEDKKSPEAADASGSGGLKKAALPGSPAPKIPGVPGKQPAGKGGGDSPAKTSVAQANKEVSKMKSIASSPTAMPTGGPVVGAPAPKPAAPVAGPAAAPGKLPAPLQGVRDKMNIAADQKAGGVGWLQRLVSSRKPAPAVAAAPGGGSAFGPTSKRATGIATSQAALARSEKPESKKAPDKESYKKDVKSRIDAEKGASKGPGHPPDCRCMRCNGPTGKPSNVTKGLNSVNHNRRLLAIKR